MHARPHDNQAITARHGDAAWLTDFITPNNPDVELMFRDITANLVKKQDRIRALWQAVADIPYKEQIGSVMTVEGSKPVYQPDTWLFPAQTIKMAPVANCANKSFLLASLLLRETPRARCVLGFVEGVEAHAWVEVDDRYILESTQPCLANPFIPANLATIYQPLVWFDNEHVWSDAKDITPVLTSHFGFCALEFLKDYICERCIGLRG